MNTDSEEFDKHLIESRRIYNYLVSEFCNRFVWLRLKELDIDPICDGLNIRFDLGYIIISKSL